MTDAPVIPGTATPAARIRAIALAVLLSALIYVPFYGLFISVALPVWMHSRRQVLWPAVSRRASMACGWVAWVGLWLPALLDLFTPVFWNAGIAISTSWLPIPLCSPDVPAATSVPALVASGVCVVGLALAVFWRRPWPWVAAAWVAPWAHQAVSALIPHQFVC